MKLSRWLSFGAAVGLALALIPFIEGQIELPAALSKSKKSANAAPPVDLSALRLTRLDRRPLEISSPLPAGYRAELTLHPAVQRAAERTMQKYRVPEAGLVALNPKTGEVIAYASHVQEGPRFDVNLSAEPPAASVFKVVTSAALLEKAQLTAETEHCYRGGRSGITVGELRENPERDKWCATLGIALGRSLNVVFGRLAQKYLTPEDLTEVGGALGFGAPIPFVVPNDPPLIEIPQEPLEFARSAAGFWHTSLSPLAAASLVQTVAHGGVTLKPRIVRSVKRGQKVVWTAPDRPEVIRRAFSKSTADELTKMMKNTVIDGSGFKTFHDAKKRPFLPGISVAAKTGTLTRHKENRHYTWLVAFAPADDPEIAVAALVVNTPRWRIKGPFLAREVLRAYFAAQGAPGVSQP